MLPVGKMNRQIKLQSPTSGIDSMGGSVTTWSDLATVWAGIENEEYSSSESTAAPHERGTVTRTYIIRNHPSMSIGLGLRVQDLMDGSLSVVGAIRYDSKRTVCYLDATSGASDV